MHGSFWKQSDKVRVGSDLPVKCLNLHLANIHDFLIFLIFDCCCCIVVMMSVADPGFPRWGHQPKGMGANLLFLAIFSQKLHKIEKNNWIEDWRP